MTQLSILNKVAKEREDIKETLKKLRLDNDSVSSLKAQLHNSIEYHKKEVKRGFIAYPAHIHIEALKLRIREVDFN